MYQTLLWDELDWAKLFKPWWGNKYVFQTGVYWVPLLTQNIQILELNGQQAGRGFTPIMIP